jgi:proline iminopeptidase
MTAPRPAETPAANVADTPRRGYYPPIEPHRTGRLRVSDVHDLYFEESGNPAGRPILFLHGGPGFGTEANHRRFFDPAAYRIVLFDQRGCGRSTPHASLVDNTTWHLVSDIEALRAHLGIEQWHVFGGSWGSTLALAYAETHPDRVTALVLRGIFLVRQLEIDWFYQRGAGAIFPDAWEKYVAPIPPDERGTLVPAFYRRLTSDDRDVRLAAAKAWSIWEGSTSCFAPNDALVAKTAGDDFAVAFARIECHYFMHRAWLEAPRDLLGNVGRIRSIPGVIVQGRYDVVCPMESAWALHRAWPEADLRVVADAGHAASEPGTLHELVEATDRLR